MKNMLKRMSIIILIFAFTMTGMLTFVPANVYATVLNNGDVIALKSFTNNKYVCAENTGANPLIARSTEIGPWEEYQVTDLGSGNFALKSLSNNKYVCAENAGADPLIARSTAIGSWETFKIIDLGNGNIALQAFTNNKYVCAENAGANPLIARSTAIGSWETFQLIIVPQTPGRSYNIVQFEDGTMAGSPLPTVHRYTENYTTIYPNFYGTGYVDWFGYNGQSVSVNVFVPCAGAYKIRIRYASGGSSSQLKVNGVSIADNYVFNSTRTWDCWKVTNEINCNLVLGSNTISVTFDSSKGNNGYTNLDEIWVYDVVSPAMTPGIATSSLGSDDVIVYTAQVTDYGAVPNSDNDATSAFQAAINAVDALGGGVVFAPAGSYRINGHLRLGASITLRGEWKSPESGGSGVGTILKAYENKDNEGGDPFIAMARSTGLKCISIWYPEQEYSNVHSYPYTIQGYVFQDTVSLLNVTLYNSYNGIRLGQDGRANGCNTFRNVYATILHRGIWQDNCFDVARLENLKFGIAYWVNSGLAGAPSTSSAQTTLKNYLYSNTIGMEFFRVDCQDWYNVSISDMKTAIWTRGPAGASVYGLNINNVGTGLLLDDLGIYTGCFQLTNCTINASIGSDPVCILSNAEAVGKNAIVLKKCTLGGTPNTAIRVTNRFIINCSEVTFSDWGYSGGTYAVDSQKGVVMIEGCNFMQNKKAIRISANTTGATILGNTFNGSPQIDNYSTGDIHIDHSAYSFEPLPTTFSLTIAPEMVPGSTTRFYNVKNAPYNAIGDGVTDDTAAIQNAMNACSTAGGGTVYVPAGEYRINSHLSVPQNVELRGSFDMQHHGMVMNGTILKAYEYKDNASGTPFITLAQNSGVRGFTIFYPDQDFRSFHAYPWTIQGQGNGCWVKYMAFINSYNAIDMNDYHPNNFVISTNHMCDLNRGITVGKGSTGGYVEDNHLNYTNWCFTSYAGAPSSSADSAICDANLRVSNISFLIGACSQLQLFQNFAIISNTGFKFISQPEGNCTNSKSLTNSTDASQNCLTIESAGNIDFVMSVFTWSAEEAIRIKNTFTNTAKFFNCATWAQFPIGSIDGGNVIFQTCDFGEMRNMKINAGTTKVLGSVFPQPGVNHVEVGSGVTSVNLTGNTGMGGFNVINNAGSKLITVHNAGY